MRAIDSPQVRAKPTKFEESVKDDLTDPDSAENYYRRGWNDKELGDYESALAAFNQALKRKPQYAHAFYGRGIVYYAQANLDAAINDMTECIHLDPGYRDAYLCRGHALCRKNMLASALRDYQQVIRLDKNHGIRELIPLVEAFLNQKSYPPSTQSTQGTATPQQPPTPVSSKSPTPHTPLSPVEEFKHLSLTESRPLTGVVGVGNVLATGPSAGKTPPRENETKINQELNSLTFPGAIRSHYDAPIPKDPDSQFRIIHAQSHIVPPPISSDRSRSSDSGYFPGTAGSTMSHGMGVGAHRDSLKERKEKIETSRKTETKKVSYHASTYLSPPNRRSKEKDDYNLHPRMGRTSSDERAKIRKTWPRTDGEEVSRRDKPRSRSHSSFVKRPVPPDSSLSSSLSASTSSHSSELSLSVASTSQSSPSSHTVSPSPSILTSSPSTTSSASSASQNIPAFEVETPLVSPRMYGDFSVSPPPKYGPPPRAASEPAHPLQNSNSLFSAVSSSSSAIPSSAPPSSTPPPATSRLSLSFRSISTFLREHAFSAPEKEEGAAKPSTDEASTRSFSGWRDAWSRRLRTKNLKEMDERSTSPNSSASSPRSMSLLQRAKAGTLDLSYLVCFLPPPPPVFDDMRDDLQHLRPSNTRRMDSVSGGSTGSAETSETMTSPMKDSSVLEDSTTTSRRTRSGSESYVLIEQDGKPETHVEVGGELSPDPSSSSKSTVLKPDRKGRMTPSPAPTSKPSSSSISSSSSTGSLNSDEKQLPRGRGGAIPTTPRTSAKGEHASFAAISAPIPIKKPHHKVGVEGNDMGVDPSPPSHRRRSLTGRRSSTSRGELSVAAGETDRDHDGEGPEGVETSVGGENMSRHSVSSKHRRIHVPVTPTSAASSTSSSRSQSRSPSPSLSPVPNEDNALRWGVDDVCDWLVSKHFNSATLLQRIRDFYVDGELLLELSEEDLRDDLEIAKRVERKRLLRDISKLKQHLTPLSPQRTAAPSATTTSHHPTQAPTPTSSTPTSQTKHHTSSLSSFQSQLSTHGEMGTPHPFLAQEGDHHASPGTSPSSGASFYTFEAPVHGKMVGSMHSPPLPPTYTTPPIVPPIIPLPMLTLPSTSHFASFVAAPTPLASTTSSEFDTKSYKFRHIPWTELSLLEQIGRGAYATVYLATWRRSRVVVKWLNHLQDTTDLDMEKFAREAELMERVGHHPHIVSFIGACLQRPDVCLVTEYVPGGSVERALVKNKDFLPLLPPDPIPGSSSPTTSSDSEESPGCLVYDDRKEGEERRKISGGHGISPELLTSGSLTCLPSIPEGQTPLDDQRSPSFQKTPSASPKLKPLQTPGLIEDLSSSSSHFQSTSSSSSTSSVFAYPGLHSRSSSSSCSSSSTSSLSSSSTRTMDINEWHRQRSNLRTVVQMAVDASAGLVHLHQMGVIHRDIATRNMLIDSQLRCRVCDFGLSRIKQKQYSAVTTKSIVGPVKWMAPESISHQRYSEVSDVYMFGITLWEMFAREEPYPEMEPLAAALAVVTQGLRPTIPLPHGRYCPNAILQLMQKCWAHEPEQRPNMKTVNDILVKVLDSL